ncbi:response regulator [Ornithinibacillus sp. L9]|uniref:Response regulator n=1 Tax=Ornithinibacillus caprae TaxID=2678566 RepID=A0A6N8FDW1_9BACI|nr:response regulator [Ornithinibacillus caprae]MUK87723.1 response regulator [Ornithinibacillus caprae]
MRILVAEDELLERKAFIKFIRDTFSDMEVVGEAANGRMAIELAESMNPDVIFMDIKMPGINGLEAIEKINAMNPTIKFILVSAYDSFDYAKQAMRFGIKDYILKPGKKEEIVKALLRVRKEMEQESTLKKEKIQTEKLMKERFLAKLMHLPIDEEVKELQERLYPSMKNGCFFVLHGDSEIQTERIEKSLYQYIDFPFIMSTVDDRMVVVILTEEALEKADILKLARKIHVDLGEQIYIGVGTSYPIENLPKSYQEAYSACHQLKIDQGSNYGFLQKGKRDQTAEEIIAMISDEIEKGNGDQAVTIFKDYQHMLPVSERENLYIKVKHIIGTLNISQVKGSISSLKTEHDWSSFLQICGLKVEEYYQSKQFKVQITTYIHDHFHENLSLEEAAAHMELSPNYFSNVFKQEFGETFIDYVTKVRMQKAKELVENSSYSLKEISYMTGYKDPNYFSRVFKKHFHLSPKQFKKVIVKK